MKKHLKITPELCPSLIVRFWAKVEKSDGCWKWKASHVPLGYGKIMLRSGRSIYAHRLSFVLAKGEIPEGLTLDHLCRNPQCVNPDHLEAVTMQVNVHRGIGPCAKNIKKTHCPRGHALVEGNIYTKKGKGRSCRRCAIDMSVVRNRERRLAA